MNKYPAKIFIGDTGTLVPASIYLGLAVYSDHLYPVILVLTPHLINIIIKYMSAGVSSRTDHSPLEYKDGLLYLPKNNYLSLIRLYLLSGPKDEKRIVYYVYAIESVFCILALLINYIY
jgi:UDP-N-acetylmuramyl pentapeptide phosphotransferase/UDP-N-acetylglucosamine-1-phosphate transferase